MVGTAAHVTAARKMTGKPGRVIRYVVTVAGPEPTDEIQNPLDYEHYVDRQVRPIAEPVLNWLGLELKKVTRGREADGAVRLGAAQPTSTGRSKSLLSITIDARRSGSTSAR